MAAYAALVSLINNIHQIMNHPHLSASFDNNQIQPLLEKAGSLLRFIEANNYGGGSKEAQDLEWEIASAAHAAEDVIESHLVARIHAGTSEPSLSCSLELQQITQEMDAAMKKADEFKGSPGPGEAPPTPVNFMEIGDTVMVGLDAELDQLLVELTSERPSNLHTISIVGMGGTGKTTLAKNSFQNQLIMEHFHFRAWATISQQHKAKETFSQLLHGLREYSNVAEDDLGNNLHKHLFGRRYLIILDDIWSVQAWLDVRRFFPDNNNGSRVVLTTRLSDVAKDCGSSPFIMKLLDEDNSMKLFCEVAFKNEPCPPELGGVSEEIVKLCKGLALSIVVMGGLLFKSPKSVEYWKGVVEDIKVLKEKQESLDVLSLSYTHLPPHLKPCFLYMGVFNEDARIRVSNVVKLWVAEGFIKPNGSQDLEEIGEGYLKDLIDRNLILVGELRKNGKVGSCGIHDLLRDLCIKVAEQLEFFHVSEDDSMNDGSWRRFICWRSDIVGQIPLIMTGYVGLPIEQELLRVLNCQEPLDAEELYRNANLRYLAYHYSKWPFLWWVPRSVSLVWNLQTLIIEGDYQVLVVFSEFWKMRQLRHVKCRKIYLPRCNRGDEMLILENLRTLKTALNLSLSEEACKSIPNIKKLGLLYDPDLYGYDDCLIEDLCNLGRLDKLESLNLKIGLGWSHCLEQLNEKLRFPSSLNKLCLSGCFLEWEDLAVMVGSLPQLLVLMLEVNSVCGKEWSPVDGQFQHLKFLKINVAELEHWDADHFHFPVLEKLVLCNIWNFKEIPEGVGDISTLKLIRVEDCSMSIAISAVRIQEVQFDNGNDSLQIQVKYESVVDMEEFKERVQSEGLSISNIQLDFW